jgi:hypothetical protein
VVVEFLYRKGIIDTNAENFGTGNEIWLMIISILGVGVIMYLIFNTSKTNNKLDSDNNDLKVLD